MVPLAPVYLIGLAAAGIPLVLHLIYRRHALKMPFPTLRFLLLSNERTAHRRRIQNLLLLLLRMLLFILLAFALSQFIIKLTEGSGLLETKGAVVLVVDNSYSMGTESEGKTRYALAKEAAFAILRGLRPGDEAAVLFTCGPEVRLDRQLTANVQAVQNEINRSKCSAERANLALALRDAQDLLLARTTNQREIYVLTDMQKLSWETGTAAGERPDTALVREQRAGIPVVVFDAGRAVAKNLAVRDVHVSGHALVKGTPVTIDADVVNPGVQPAGTMVSLFVGGQPKGKREIEVPANSVGIASFACELPESGVAPVEIKLGDDDLADDNARHLKLEVKEKVRALIVQDARSAVAFLDQSYFLERALDPSIALGGPAVSIIRPDRMLLGDLQTAKLHEYDVVFLLNVRTMPDPAAAGLIDFVRKGGGLVIFAGEDVDPAEYARLFAQGPDPLLPLPLRPTDKAPPDRKAFALVTSVDESHFVFAPFRGLNLLKSVRVYKHANIDLHATTPMVTLARLADGTPLILEHTCGKGKVVFLGVTADAAWSNLPVTDIFLPLVHQIVYHVSGSFEERDSLAIGAPYRFSFPETAARVDIDVRSPDGIEETVSSQPTTDANKAVYAKTFRPGYYSYSTRGGVARQGAFVVNPDTAESNLEPVSAGELEKHLSPAKVTVCSKIDEVLRLIASLRQGLHLRDLFVAITVVVAVFETIISNWVTPAPGAKKRGVVPAAGEDADE